MSDVKDSYHRAIGVKYVPATDTKGTRLKAFVKFESEVTNKLVVSWDYELDVSTNYCNAAKKMAEKMGWKGNMIGGVLGKEYVFVFNQI